MPLVFVHGVATRQSPKYIAEVKQRDDLFRRLVMGKDAFIRDPDWGSNAVHFAKRGWVPTGGVGETWSVGSPVLPDAASAASAIARKDLDSAVDLAFAALLSSQAEKASASDPAISEEQLQAFESAVKYLESGGDRTAFGPGETDSQFAQTLRSELEGMKPSTGAEAMGLQDVFAAIGKAMKAITDPLRNVGSDAVLKLVRVPLSEAVALFLGDIFVYLRWRETDGAAGTYNRIFKPIIQDLADANAARKPGEKLILVCHSLGAVLSYDLLTDKKAVSEIEAKSGKPLAIDAWVTVGAQPGLFADMGLYSGHPGADGRLAKPAVVQRWMNVYDFTDVLSFRTEPFFAGVTDFKFDNVAGALDAHTAYFQRPSFYKRLRARLSQP